MEVGSGIPYVVPEIGYGAAGPKVPPRHPGPAPRVPPRHPRPAPTPGAALGLSLTRRSVLRVVRRVKV